MLYCISASLARSLLIFCLRASARCIAVCLLRMDSYSCRSLSISCCTLASSSSSSSSHPNHRPGRDQAPCLLEACVLVKVPAGVTNAGSLWWLGLR
jgi:hypothetical protein